MPKKRTKKRTTKKKASAKRVNVCKAKLDRLAHLGATHHKTLQELKASAYAVPVKKRAKKAKKKATKKRKKVAKKVGKKRAKRRVRR